MELAHVALWVEDVDRAESFYEQLGFERDFSFTHEGVENVYLNGEEGRQAVQLRHDPGRTTPISPGRADVDHVALKVEAAEAAFETALEAGATAVSEPREAEGAAVIAFVEDPDGYTLEFVQPEA